MKKIKISTEQRSKLLRYIEISVNKLELNVRTANILNYYNINSLWQLLILSDAELLRIHKLGKSSLNNIKEELERLFCELIPDLRLKDFRKTLRTETIGPTMTGRVCNYRIIQYKGLEKLLSGTDNTFNKLFEVSD